MRSFILMFLSKFDEIFTFYVRKKWGQKYDSNVCFWWDVSKKRQSIFNQVEKTGIFIALMINCLTCRYLLYLTICLHQNAVQEKNVKIVPVCYSISYEFIWLFLSLELLSWGWLWFWKPKESNRNWKKKFSLFVCSWM